MYTLEGVPSSAEHLPCVFAAAYPMLCASRVLKEEHRGVFLHCF